MPLSAGDNIGGLLGAGGMGKVYRAHDSLKRSLAAYLAPIQRAARDQRNSVIRHDMLACASSTAAVCFAIIASRTCAAPSG